MTTNFFLLYIYFASFLVFLCLVFIMLAWEGVRFSGNVASFPIGLPVYAIALHVGLRDCSPQ